VILTIFPTKITIVLYPYNYLCLFLTTGGNPATVLGVQILLWSTVSLYYVL